MTVSRGADYNWWMDSPSTLTSSCFTWIEEFHVLAPSSFDQVSTPRSHDSAQRPWPMSWIIEVIAVPWWLITKRQGEITDLPPVQGKCPMSEHWPATSSGWVPSVRALTCHQFRVSAQGETTDLPPVQAGCVGCPWRCSVLSRDGPAEGAPAGWTKGPGHPSRTWPVWWGEDREEQTHPHMWWQWWLNSEPHRRTFKWTFFQSISLTTSQPMTIAFLTNYTK